MRRRLLATVPIALLALAGCSAPDAVEQAPSDEADPSPSSVEQTPAPTPSPTVEPVAALPAMPQTCDDLDSPDTMAIASGTDYAPLAQPIEPFPDEARPTPLISCSWGPDGGSDSFVVASVADVDAAGLDVLSASAAWTAQTVGGHELHVQVSDDPSYTGDGVAWATLDGRLLHVRGYQADVWQDLAVALVPSVLG